MLSLEARRLSDDRMHVFGILPPPPPHGKGRKNSDLAAVFTNVSLLNHPPPCLGSQSGRLLEISLVKRPILGPPPGHSNHPHLLPILLSRTVRRLGPKAEDKPSAFLWLGCL